MLRLHRTLALCFWCLLLVRKQTSADEEGLWGPTASREKPPPKKYGSYWWMPSLPKLPSLPSLPFPLPFYPAGGQSETTELDASGRELSDPTDQSASGDGGIATEAAALPAGSTRSLSGATEIRTESLPAGTSHPPHGSGDNGAVVATSATHIGNTLRPISSGMPEQNATRRHPHRDTTLALTAQDGEFLHTMSTTTAPEFTVHPDQTSINPETGITFHPTPPDTTAEKTQNSTESLSTRSTSLRVITTITPTSGKATAPKAEGKQS